MNAIFTHETNDCKIFAHTAQVHVDNRDYGLAREYITRAENALREADAAMKSGATQDEGEHEDQLETMSDLSDTLQSLEKQLSEA